MKTRFLTRKSFMAFGCTLLIPVSLPAQSRLEVHGKADFVSSYIWRGIDQNHGFALQPSLSFGYKGLTLSAWGSTPISNFSDPKNAREFDLTLSYTIKGLTLMATDYWWGGQAGLYGYYQQSPSNDYIDGHHHFEGTIAYYFGKKLPLTLSWSTWLAGADIRKSGNGRRAFSSYLHASYDIALPSAVTLTPAIGFSPWESYYSHNSRIKDSRQTKATCTDITLTAAKDIRVNDSFSIPVFVQAVVSPAYDHSCLIAGFSFGF